MKDLRAAGSASEGSAGRATDWNGPAGKSTLVEQLDTNEEPEPPKTQAAQQIATTQPRAAGGGGGGSEAPRPGTKAPKSGTDSNAPPAEQYVIPFDHAPKSVAGEEILFGATYTHATPSDYKLVFTSVGGDFDTKSSGTKTKTYSGLNARNVVWFVAPAWDGASAVTMKLEVVKTADGSVADTKSWTFAKKPYHPTTVTQRETEGERDIPAIYRYKVGPARNTTGAADYKGFTILEKFQGPYSTTMVPTDLKPAYVQAHGLDSSDKIAAHFFPGTGANGTFTPNDSDEIADQHGGVAGMAKAKAELATPKDIQKTLVQSYESNPGTPLATYNITRIMKIDGSTKITKKKV